MSIIPNLNNQAISILSDIDQAKENIAEAINIKGGNASADSSFSQLASDIENLNDSFITYGVKADPKIDWVMYMCRIAVEARRGLLEVDRDDIKTISNPSAFQNCINLQRIALPNLTNIDSDKLFLNCKSLKSVELPNLTEIKCSNTFSYCDSLESVELPNLTIYSGSSLFIDCSNILRIKLPNITTISGQNTFYRCTSLQSLEFGTLISVSTTVIVILDNLNNITIGQDTDITLPFHQWKATNVIAEGQSGIDELNDNLYNNLLTKLYDHSTDGQTRTLRLGWLANVSQANIDYATAKGWTLTT